MYGYRVFTTDAGQHMLLFFLTFIRLRICLLLNCSRYNVSINNLCVIKTYKKQILCLGNREWVKILHTLHACPVPSLCFELYKYLNACQQHYNEYVLISICFLSKQRAKHLNQFIHNWIK